MCGRAAPRERPATPSRDVRVRRAPPARDGAITSGWVGAWGGSSARGLGPSSQRRKPFARASAMPLLAGWKPSRGLVLCFCLPARRLVGFLSPARWLSFAASRAFPRRLARFPSLAKGFFHAFFAPFFGLFTTFFTLLFLAPSRSWRFSFNSDKGFFFFA